MDIMSKGELIGTLKLMLDNHEKGLGGLVPDFATPAETADVVAKVKADIAKYEAMSDLEYGYECEFAYARMMGQLK